jgi:hypothetical protein
MNEIGQKSVTSWSERLIRNEIAIFNLMGRSTTDCTKSNNAKPRGVTVSIPVERYTKESRVMHLSDGRECSDMFTYTRRYQERRVKSEGATRFRAGITRSGRVGAESGISGALFGIDACRGLMTL